MHALGHREGLFAVLDGARTGDNGEAWSADRSAGAGKTDDRVLLLEVAADQFVRLGDLDDFLHTRHFFERALFDLALVAGDADGSTGRARHRVSAISHLLDLLANGAYLLFGGVRLHDDQHKFTLGAKEVETA